MYEKQYPKTVVLKKSLIGVVVFALFLLLLLIFYNFYAAIHQQKKHGEQAFVQSVASPADTNWYQHQTIQKPIRKESMVLREPAAQSSHHFKKEGAPLTKHHSNLTQQESQNLREAMRAPINSNQLLGEQLSAQGQTTPVHVNSVPGNVLPTGGGEYAEQNRQADKTAFLQSQALSDGDTLGEILKNPISPYELQAGSIIPGILITGINSDLPGQITGQVKTNVYDSISGRHLLIPQGAKLTGVYDSQVAYGQERVLVAWKRILFPNGQSINLAGMPGVDMSGYAGFHDQVNNHYSKIFGSVLLMSVMSAGAQLSQPQTSNSPFQAPTVGQTIAQSVGANIANTGTMITAKNINIQPTLEIRPGYEFNIAVTKDMVFPSAYAD
jgi:type IV secretory pathway VirB10-like protein